MDIIDAYMIEFDPTLLFSIFFIINAFTTIKILCGEGIAFKELFFGTRKNDLTTILLPAELQGIASIAETFKAAAGKKAE